MIEVDRPAGQLTELLLDLARVPRVGIPMLRYELLPPGTALGRFVVERAIGRGGFGVVYAARDPDLGRDVAIKLLRWGIGLARSDGGWIQREAEAVARLSHPAIVTLFDVGRCEHGAYLVFELLLGETLEARIARELILPREALRITSTVAEALAHAHAAGVLHRDLKPANVFLCTAGAVKVLDFGIAQLFDREETPSSGTPGYMPPEQRDGGAQDARTDLFTLGVMLKAMVRGGGGERSGGARGSREAEALAEALTQQEMARRPRGAREVKERADQLARRLEPGRRSAWLAAAGALLLAAMAAAWGWPGRERPPGERVVAALGPTLNRSGVAALDDLSGVVEIGLRQSDLFVVRGPARLRPLVPSLDEASQVGAWSEEARRLGARLLVLPKAEGDASSLRISLRVLDVATGAVSYQDGATAAALTAVPALVDQAILGLRRSLGDRGPASAGAAGRLSSPSVEAFHLFARGAACVEAAAEGGGLDDLQRCGAPLLKALELDPTFALAHYQLARLSSLSDHGSVEARRHLEAALARPTRLATRDEALALAWRDHLQGDDGAAVGRCAAILSGDPEDLQALALAGDLHFHAARHAEAIPFLAKLAATAPGAQWALDHLVVSLALAGRAEELAPIVAAEDPPGPARLRPVVHALGWMGRHDQAVRVAAQGRTSLPGSTGGFLLLEALTAAGRLEEAAALAEALQRAEPGHRGAFAHRVKLAVAGGHYQLAWRLAEAPPAATGGASAVDRSLLKATIAAGQPRVDRLRAETRKLAASAPDYLPLAAVPLALVGSLEDGRQAATLLSPTSTAGKEVAALLAWRAGDVAGAVSVLAGLEGTDPWPNDALAPAYLLAEVALASDPSEALGAATRFRRQLPRGPWRPWAEARALLIAAEAAARLGRRDEGACFLAELEGRLATADRGLALLDQVGRLRRTLPGSAAVCAAGPR